MRTAQQSFNAMVAGILIITALFAGLSYFELGDGEMPDGVTGAAVMDGAGEQDKEEKQEEDGAQPSATGVTAKPGFTAQFDDDNNFIVSRTGGRTHTYNFDDGTGVFQYGESDEYYIYSGDDKGFVRVTAPDEKGNFGFADAAGKPVEDKKDAAISGLVRAGEEVEVDENALPEGAKVIPEDKENIKDVTTKREGPADSEILGYLQKTGEWISATSTYQGISYLFYDDEELDRMRDEIQAGIIKTFGFIPTAEFMASEICGSSDTVDFPGGSVRVMQSPGGLIVPAAIISGTRSPPIERPKLDEDGDLIYLDEDGDGNIDVDDQGSPLFETVTEYLYKIEFSVTMPSDFDEDTEESLVFNVQLKKDDGGWINMLNASKQLAEGQTWGQSGSSIVPFFSNEFYTEAKIHFIEKMEDRWGQEVDDVSDRIVPESAEPETFGEAGEDKVEESRGTSEYPQLSGDI